MLSAFRAVMRGLSALNQRPPIYVLANLVVFVLCVPVITVPLAWAGLVYLSIRLQTVPGTDMGDFWGALRRYWRQGMVMGFLNVLVLVVNLSNLLAYWGAPGLQYALLRAVWLFTLVVWAALNLYLWPLFFSMKEPSLPGALRNAGVMMLLNPGFTVGLLLALALVVVVSLILIVPWPLFTLSAFACIAVAAVLDRLEAAGLREPASPPPPDEFPHWEE